MTTGDDDPSERPQRVHQRRYESSTRGRETNRERQRRFVNKLKEAAAEVAELRRENAELRRRAGSDLGLTTAHTPLETAGMLWTMKGRQACLQIAEIWVRRAYPGKTLKHLLRDED